MRRHSDSEIFSKRWSHDPEYFEEDAQQDSNQRPRDYSATKPLRGSRLQRISSGFHKVTVFHPLYGSHQIHPVGNQIVTRAADAPSACMPGSYSDR